VPDANGFKDVVPSGGAYFLGGAQLEWPDADIAIFRATLNGPTGAPVWARAWLSTEAGTLAEAASTQLTAGEAVTLIVRLNTTVRPQSAYMRVESAPLKMEPCDRLDGIWAVHTPTSLRELLWPHWRDTSRHLVSAAQSNVAQRR
jgi:hypothetical protein